MKAVKFLGFFIFGIIVTGCSTTSSIVTDYDRGATFSKYKTYYWANEFNKDTSSGNEDKPLFYNTLIQKRLKNAIQKQMSDKGYALAKESPDLLLNATIQVGQHETSSASSSVYPYAYSPFYPGFGNYFGYYYGFYGTQRTSSSTHMAGGLIIELIDRSERQLVWQGYAADVLHTDTQDKREELNDAVDNIFSKYDERFTK